MVKETMIPPLTVAADGSLTIPADRLIGLDLTPGTPVHVAPAANGLLLSQLPVDPTPDFNVALKNAMVDFQAALEILREGDQS